MRGSLAALLALGLVASAPAERRKARYDVENATDHIITASLWIDGDLVTNKWMRPGDTSTLVYKWKAKSTGKRARRKVKVQINAMPSPIATVFWERKFRCSRDSSSGELDCKGKGDGTFTGHERLTVSAYNRSYRRSEAILNESSWRKLGLDGHIKVEWETTP
jgi:hypothetical protein